MTSSAGGGRDDIYGGPGDDHLDGGSWEDSLYGGGNRDHLHGRRGHDWIAGGYGRDESYAGSGADLLRGGTSSDFFYISGSGIDHVFGGLGPDTIIMAVDYKVDRIYCGPPSGKRIDSVFYRSSGDTDPRDELQGCEMVDVVDPTTSVAGIAQAWRLEAGVNATSGE